MKAHYETSQRQPTAETHARLAPFAYNEHSHGNARIKTVRRCEGGDVALRCGLAATAEAHSGLDAQEATEQTTRSAARARPHAREEWSLVNVCYPAAPCLQLLEKRRTTVATVRGGRQEREGSGGFFSEGMTASVPRPDGRKGRVTVRLLPICIACLSRCTAQPSVVLLQSTTNKIASDFAARGEGVARSSRSAASLTARSDNACMSAKAPRVIVFYL
ncbi:hypothetical protein FQR65_LT20975 [Abscondita terminalis]|nr:hypothetical protein FQR65_LT20975 [Abscondita terminalis]